MRYLLIKFLYANCMLKIIYSCILSKGEKLKYLVKTQRCQSCSYFIDYYCISSLHDLMDRTATCLLCHLFSCALVAHIIFGFVGFWVLSILMVSGGQLLSWWKVLSFIDYTCLVGCNMYVVGSICCLPNYHNEPYLVAFIRFIWCLNCTYLNNLVWWHVLRPTCESVLLSDFECGIHSGCWMIYTGVGMGKMDTWLCW